MKALDLSGQVFGRISVVDRADGKKGKSAWNCICSCGSELVIVGTSLTKQLFPTRSCGCLTKEIASQTGKRCGPINLKLVKANVKHGMWRSATYRSWMSMLKRCTNQNCEQYQWYGARGVVVCDRWRDFRNFFADMGERPGIDHCLARDRDRGNYQPGNVAWKTKSQNSRERHYRDL